MYSASTSRIGWLPWLAERRDWILLTTGLGLLVAFLHTQMEYRLWAVLTIASGPVWLLATPWSRDTFRILAGEVVFLSLYWLAIVMSLLNSGEPLLSNYFVAADLFLFAIPMSVLFLTIALFNPPERIMLALRLLTWAGVTATVLWWTEIRRLDTKAWWILPFLVPFVVHAIYDARRIAYLEFAALFSVLIISQTRWPIVVAAALAAASFLWLAPSAKLLLARSAVAAAVTLATLFALYQVPPTGRALVRTYVRFVGEPVVLSEADAKIMKLPHKVLPAEAPDEARARIPALFDELVAARGVTLFGIGYRNFEKIYERRFGVPPGKGSTEHNIFKAWLIEIGLFGLAAVIFLLLRFFWICGGAIMSGPPALRPYFKCLALAMVGFMLYGLLHPVHAGPVMFMLLGLAFGTRAQTDRRIYAN